MGKQRVDVPTGLVAEKRGKRDGRGGRGGV